MAALLNALQMGFQTVAIQKRADEIQKVLSAVKSELPKYRDELKKAQRQLTTAAKTIDNLVGTRTRAMEKTLKNVTGTNSLAEADSVLGIEEDSEGEVDTSQD
jgi:DNA recombination protein RmuC